MSAGYLYLIHCVGFPYYKIGITTGVPLERKKVLQRCMPFELDLLATAKTDELQEEEERLLFEFEPYKVRGEWFMLNGERLDLALRLLSELQERTDLATSCRAKQ